jgi:hypothetical protein
MNDEIKGSGSSLTKPPRRKNAKAAEPIVTEAAPVLPEPEPAPALMADSALVQSPDKSAAVCAANAKRDPAFSRSILPVGLAAGLAIMAGLGGLGLWQGLAHRWHAERQALETRIEALSGDLGGLRVSLAELNAKQEKRSAQQADAQAWRQAAQDLRNGLDRSNQDAAKRQTELMQRFEQSDRQRSELLARLERLEKRPVAAVQPAQEQASVNQPALVTGSIAPKQSSVPDKAQAANKPDLPPIKGWVLRGIEPGGVALVEGRQGLFEVSRGGQLPGAGKVEKIEKRGRDWVVVTEKGLIFARP